MNSGGGGIRALPWWQEWKWNLAVTATKWNRKKTKVRHREKEWIREERARVK
jgi:hypothetical protein